VRTCSDGLARARAAAVLALSLGVTASTAGCPGTIDDKDRFLVGGGGQGGGCGDVPTQLLASRCATSGCHDADSPAASLDLTADAELTGRLVGIEGQCGGLLVDRDDPGASLMFTKCLPTNACASRMPLTGEPLTADEEACLLAWVSSL
jgi:hypothetical protein